MGSPRPTGSSRIVWELTNVNSQATLGLLNAEREVQIHSQFSKLMESANFKSLNIPFFPPLGENKRPVTIVCTSHDAPPCFCGLATLKAHLHFPRAEA